MISISIFSIVWIIFYHILPFFYQILVFQLMRGFVYLIDINKYESDVEKKKLYKFSHLFTDFFNKINPKTDEPIVDNGEKRNLTNIYVYISLIFQFYVIYKFSIYSYSIKYTLISFLIYFILFSIFLWSIFDAIMRNLLIHKQGNLTKLMEIYNSKNENNTNS